MIARPEWTAPPRSPQAVDVSFEMEGFPMPKHFNCKGLVINSLPAASDPATPLKWPAGGIDLTKPFEISGEFSCVFSQYAKKLFQKLFGKPAAFHRCPICQRRWIPSLSRICADCERRKK